MQKTRQNLCRIFDKIDVIVEVDAHTGTRVDLVLALGLVKFYLYQLMHLFSSYIKIT